MAPKKSNSKKGKSLVPMGFQLNEMVFAKQKGYAPWPAFITGFHPQKPRCAKVEFFAWNQQWAYISFNSLSKMEAGKSLAEQQHSDNIQLQKAIKEMDFVVDVAQRIVNDRLRMIKESEHSSNESKAETVGQRKSNQNKQKTKFKESVVSNLEPFNGIRTRSQSCSSSISLPIRDGGTSQIIPINSNVVKVGRSDLPMQQQRGKRSKDQALSNLATVQRRGRIGQSNDEIETVKPAASRIRTRSQSANEQNAKKFRK